MNINDQLHTWLWHPGKASHLIYLRQSLIIRFDLNHIFDIKLKTFKATFYSLWQLIIFVNDE